MQIELLGRIDEKLDSGAWVVVTADRVPGQLTNLMPAIGSRLEAGLTLPLASPGLAVRRAFLRRAAARHGLPLEPHEIDELAQRLPATMRQLTGAVQQAKLAQLTESSTEPSEVSRTSTPDAAAVRPLRPDEVFAVTARYFGISQAALKSASRMRSLVHARSVAMYLARELAGCTLQEIGQLLGGRDHTTVLHACRKIDKSASQEVTLQEELADLRRLLLAT
jgi:chromosomal replication initiator protein